MMMSFRRSQLIRGIGLVRGIRSYSKPAASATPAGNSAPDIVQIKDLSVSCITGKDYWSRAVSQPLSVSIDLKTSFKKASETDDLKYSLNYATISRNLLDFFNTNKNKNFHNLESISDQLFEVIFDKENGSNGKHGVIVLTNSKSEIRCDSVELVQEKEASEQIAIPKIYKINKLRLLTIIGVFNFERLQKQIVDLDIEVEYNTRVLKISSIIDKVTKYVESAQFKTVEALVESVAHLVLSSTESISTVKVGVIKPNAILFANGVGVSIKRTRDELATMRTLEFDIPGSSSAIEQGTEVSLPNFNQENELSSTATSATTSHTVYIAFGSNHGDSFANINIAFAKLKQHGIQILSTSSLYESKPMYHLDQPNFYNGVIKVSCQLGPHELLKVLKTIEYDDLHRVKEFANGPRSIDLDIILYDDLILNDRDLKIPHISMIDRTFVMAPLCELVSNDAVHPVTAEPFHSHLKQLLQKESDPSVQESNKLLNVVPLPRGRVLGFDTFGNQNKTLIMGILNATPDSFSDGGDNYSITDATESVKQMISNGVDVIDIGGCSTRPGSEQVSEEEELQRVVPLIKAIRSFDTQVIISIDTYRSRVAEESILAGADIINDISAGQFDEQIIDVAVKYDVPIILSHTRGDINTMTKLTDYSATINGEELEVADGSVLSPLFSEQDKQVVSVVGKELCMQIGKALSKGLKKWQIIIDPGIGFAKNTEQNLSVIRGAPVLKQLSFINHDEKEFYFSMQRLPLLLAPSRKKFIGHITQTADTTQPKERIVGNIATLTACIGYGAHMIRVHDYKEANQLTLMADAIFKDIK